MPIRTPKELFVQMLSELRDGAERCHQVYGELGKMAQNHEIREALEAREFIRPQILDRLDECFRLIGEKPVPGNPRLYDLFIEDCRNELAEIHAPAVRKMFVLSRASRLIHLRIGEYSVLIAAAELADHPGVGILLESCLADKTAFAERMSRLIGEHLREAVFTA